MACGMPVIVTKVGVMPSVVKDGENGIFTTGDCEDLAKKIGILLKNDLQRESLSEEATKVLDLYERTKLIRQYADFLKSQA
jgi:glycosyltransferase involved in cell wall biosynthesis